MKIEGKGSMEPKLAQALESNQEGRPTLLNVKTFYKNTIIKDSYIAIKTPRNEQRIQNIRKKPMHTMTFYDKDGNKKQ